MNNFVGDVFRRTTTMTVAENRMAAPVAGIRAAARHDQRYGTNAMVPLPCRKIAFEIDRRAVGKGLGVEIGDLGTRRGSSHLAFVAAKYDAGDYVESGEAV